ncbi:120 KDa Rickettsia-like surface antigen domain protein [Candidatus Trichorickettsia mobilis]|uniref:Antigenic heat-stable 120 kDa protein n=1 Tax=Candidatus Trichorickettsia mobilis TaxID=1346319 RepID=A0ABZ0UV68_9RICK|nr:Sca4 family protein [Candidatus Trichorickettsia mobilis]WPY00819.1 120 KDa Rickettsia-like surface antigen domain protein [Candidatus Trichorickettsia mobilis]
MSKEEDSSIEPPKQTTELNKEEAQLSVKEETVVQNKETDLQVKDKEVESGLQTKLEPEQQIQPQKTAQDSIGFEDKEFDTITKEIRDQVISKQLGLLQNALSEQAENEEQKAQIKKLSQLELSQFLQDEKNKDSINKALADPKLNAALNNAEVEGYGQFHNKFKDKFQDLQWGPGSNESTRSKEVKNKDGQSLCTLTETMVKEPTTVTLADGSTKEVSGYRKVDFPKELTGEGPLHLSMAVKGADGKNIAEDKAVYFSAHYDKQGKLTEVSTPMPVKFMGKGDDAIGYIERDGNIYTLPVTQGKYKEMMKEVAKNQGMGMDLSQTLDVPVKTNELAEKLGVNAELQTTPKNLEIEAANQKLALGDKSLADSLGLGTVLQEKSDKEIKSPELEQSKESKNLELTAEEKILKEKSDLAQKLGMDTVLQVESTDLTVEAKQKLALDGKKQEPALEGQEDKEKANQDKTKVDDPTKEEKAGFQGLQSKKEAIESLKKTDVDNEVVQAATKSEIKATDPKDKEPKREDPVVELQQDVEKKLEEVEKKKQQEKKEAEKSTEGIAANIPEKQTGSIDAEKRLQDTQKRLIVDKQSHEAKEQIDIRMSNDAKLIATGAQKNLESQQQGPIKESIGTIKPDSTPSKGATQSKDTGIQNR